MFLRKQCPRKTCAPPHRWPHRNPLPKLRTLKGMWKTSVPQPPQVHPFPGINPDFWDLPWALIGFQGKTLPFLMYCCSEKLLQAACHSMGNFQTSWRQIHDLFIFSRQLILRKKVGKLQRTCQIILPRTCLNHIKKTHSLQIAAERSKYVL